MIEKLRSLQEVLIFFFFYLTLLTAQVSTKDYTLANMNNDDNEKYHYLRKNDPLI